MIADKVYLGSSPVQKVYLGSTLLWPKGAATAPTIIADDTANTLDATSTYGDSEILVSINNAAFTQFDGSVINIGNVSLPTGYYKFKVKAASGRSESTVVNSPAFTPAVVSQPNSYTLSSDSVSSAGVYKQDNTLVRTLWSGKKQTAGNYPILWDGGDDKQVALPVDNYNIKVLSNNVQYTWEEVMGNTSHGDSRHTAFEPPSRIAIAGTRAYYTVGYNEGNAGVAAFDLNNIQVRLDPFSGFGGWVATDQMVTDGTYMYIAVLDVYNDANTFVYGKRLSDGAFVQFSTGGAYQGTNIYFPSIIDFRNTHYRATGMALSANYIFVAYGGANKISVLNKATGALVREITITNAGSIAVDGSFLWVSSNTTINKYALNADGSVGTVATTISGLQSIVDFKVNGSIIAVVDGGTSQQVKAFNTSNGSLAWTLGQLGGHYTSPVVSNDRFAFWQTYNDGHGDRGGIAFQSDGSFWIVDAGNGRMMHFSANRTFIEYIMYMQHIRTCVVVGNNNKRVLGNGLEFEIDYTKPFQNGGWTLKYNWEGKYNNIVTENWITSVNTLSNGRTYGIVYDQSVGNRIVELDPATGLRYTPVILGNDMGGLKVMYPDGHLYQVGGTARGETQTWYKRTLQGFDINYNPIYSNIFALPVTYTAANGDPRLASPRPYPYERTSTNILGLFKGTIDKGVGAFSGEDEWYHFGGIDASTGKVMFKTSLGVQSPYDGEFPNDGYFDIANGVGDYAGNVVNALDRSFIWGYNGEFWKASQVNKYNHYYDNGLFVGQFGATGPEFNDGRNRAFAGNAYMPQLIKEGTDYYLYHNDESVYGGIHRWKITGINTIQEQVIPISTTYTRVNEKALPANIVDLNGTLPYRGILTANNSVGWSITNGLDSSQFTAETNRMSYGRRRSPDLHLTYTSPTSQGTYVTRTLGNNTNVQAWKLTGNIGWNGRQPNFWNGNAPNAYIDLLDTAGKMITRMYMINNQSFTSTNFMFNNNVLFTEEMGWMQIITKTLQPISITKINNAITLTYRGMSTTVTTPYEAGANMSNPGAFRIYFWTGNNEYGEKIITIDNMLFDNNLQIP